MSDTVCTKCGGTKFYTLCKNCEENPYTTIVTLKAQNDELLVALKTYGAHLPNCAYAVNHPLIDKCTCGYEAVIANAEKDKA